MALSHIITHRIDRTDPTKESTLTTRETNLTQNGYIEECFRELKLTMIKRLGKDYGRFSDDSAAHPFSAYLGEYHQEKIPFERFSQKAMQHLKITLDSTDIPLNGFVIFAHERLATAEHMHIFFVQHLRGQYINSDLAFDTSVYLDTQGLRLAATIAMDDLYSGDTHRVSSALTLLRWRGEKELSDVFTQLIGFAEKIDVSAETDVFLDAVADYTKVLPNDIAHQTNKQVVEYCLEQDKVGKPVVISELSSQLKQNPPARPEKVANNSEHSADQRADYGEEHDAPIPSLPEFSEFMSSTQPAAKPELIPDTSKLRQFVRLSGRNNQLSMSFASSCLGDSIVYDPSTDSLTIKDIPAGLKARLVKLSRVNP